MRRILILLIAAGTGTLAAQGIDTSALAVDHFTARARQATARFKDRDAAIAESYVKVGPDFPAMGEHWVNGELIMRGELDPTRPAILTYTNVAGKPTLTGVVYALALARNEAPPMLPVGAGWHDHVGSIDEESLLFGHDHHSDDDIRLVVMHAWIWQPNPDGMFATDNWALPFARLGLAPPSTTNQSAARAIALLSDSGAYFAQLFARVGELDDGEATRVEAVLGRRREELERWWTRRTPSPRLTTEEIVMLEANWTGLAREVAAAVSRNAAMRLEKLLSAND
jgi:hypothetical protein